MHRVYPKTIPIVGCDKLSEPCEDVQDTHTKTTIVHGVRKRKRNSRKSCPRCKEDDLIMEDEEELYCLNCGIVYHARGRQGRNQKSREKKDNNPVCYEDSGCQNCKSFIGLVSDYVSGDLVCTECGFVNDSGGRSFTRNILIMKKNSKNYKRNVHFRQRLAQLRGHDPEIDENDLEKIREHVIQNQIDVTRLGKKNMMAICKIIGLPKKMSGSWIQIRNELDWFPNSSGITQLDDPVFASRFEVRYGCVEVAFNSILSAKHGSSHKLKRTNIVNLNYLMPQIIRLESETLWSECAKFFKQLTHDDHPEDNNQRWREIINFCDAHFRRARASREGGEFVFEWPYKPMTREEILTKYNYFY